LFEEVIGELRIGSQPNPQIVNVLRRGSFEPQAQWCLAGSSRGTIHSRL